MIMFWEEPMVNSNIFLIENHLPIEIIRKKVVDAPYMALGKVFTTSRFRGTKIARKEDGYEIIAWQRNIARLQKMDVSLPTVISLSLDNEMVVKSAFIDESFAGSQGISCCYKYLKRILQQNLEGEKFVFENKQIISLDRLHCVHFHEVLIGALSLIEVFNGKNLKEYDEVETGQAVIDGNDLKIIDYQKFSDGRFINWEIILHDYKKKLQFGINGEVKKITDLAITFKVRLDNGEEDYMEYRIDAEHNMVISALSRFAMKCWKTLNHKMGFPKGLSNNNLLPLSIIGLIIQSVGIIIFSDNYNYIQHLLAALQRKGDKPLCIGIAKNIKEMSQYFPRFKVEDLY